MVCMSACFPRNMRIAVCRDGIVSSLIDMVHISSGIYGLWIRFGQRVYH